MTQFNNTQLKRKEALATMAGASTTALSFPSLLNAETQRSSGQAKQIIQIVLPGGFTQLDSFDPKPQTPSIMGDTKTVPTSNGDILSNYFPELAKRLHKICLIRSMSSPEADHSRASYLLQTSYTMLGTIKHPFLGAWIEKFKGKLNDGLPSSVSINGGGSGGYMGRDYDPFYVGNATNALEGIVKENPTSEENVKLLKLMANVRKKFHQDYKTVDVDSYRTLYNSAIRFMQSDDIKAFDINLEDKGILAKYAKSSYGNRFLLARRLIEHGVQYVTLGVGSWDDHADLWNVFPPKAKELDMALSTFIDDFFERGLDKNVVFTLTTEFGRSPELDKFRGGRNHHRKTFCSLIGGAGIKPGLIYGKTDDYSQKVIENPVVPVDFNATLAHVLGLPLDKEIYSDTNRPFTVARGGKVIQDLLA